MFDDPNKALKKLQEQLMAAEEPEEDPFAPPRPEPEDAELDTEPDASGEEFPEEETTQQREASERNRRQTKAALLAALLLLEVAALLGVLAWWLLW